MACAMQRIAAILLLYVLLINAPAARPDPPLPPTALHVTARPLPVPPQSYGPLRLTGLWHLTGSHRAFGGISALLVDDNGHVLALADSGETTRFTLTGGPARIAALPRTAAIQSEPRWKQDSESMTRDPRTGRIWVGFERVQRICRYAPDLSRAEACVEPPAVARWPEEGSLESLVRLGDGRFLAISERAPARDGGFDMLLWAGDPVEGATPPPVRLSYRGPPGYRPTDALWLGGDRLLVLERRLTLAEGFTARLALVRMPALRAGAVLVGEPIADFRRPGPVDNLEALALARDSAGKPLLYIASDDNRLFLQRTLLFRFALPDDWVSDAPAP